MEEKDKQINRREFLGQVGIGVAALGHCRPRKCSAQIAG